MFEPETTANAAARLALGLGVLANMEPSAPAGVFAWLVQLGALGLLSWYFLRVEPQQRREEREARQRELEMLLKWREGPGDSKGDRGAPRDRGPS